MMQPDLDLGSASKPAQRAGAIIGALAVLFLIFDCVIKLLMLGLAMDATAQLGYPRDLVFGIGLVEAVCLVLYLVPRTSILGAILLTGYLGGAVASQVRIGNPLFSNILFPIYIATMIWAALVLRDSRLRTLVPLRN